VADERAPHSGWRIGLPVAGAALSIAALVVAALAGGAAWRAWTAAAFLCVSAPTGALVLLMMMQLIPGAWAREAEPYLKAQALLAPLSAAAMLPVLFELGAIYRWVGQAEATAFRTAWLSPPAFIACTVIWLAVLCALAVTLTLRPVVPRAVACVGLLLVAVLDTFAATDWLQSMDPAFRSSGFGLYIMGLQTLFALAVALVLGLAAGAPWRRPGIMGGLLLTLLLIWAYFDFMPFFITWSGDVPSGAVWYMRRSLGVWGDLGWLIAACRLGPAFLLLFAAVRNSRRWLLLVAATVAAGTAPELAWIALPAAPGAPAADAWTAAVFVLAVLGLVGLAAAGAGRALEWRGARP
jgi:hypothetical protein